MTTLFFIEHANGKVSDQSLKAISATKDLGEEVHGMIAGTAIDSVVDEVSKISGVSKIIPRGGSSNPSNVGLLE